ncbi:PREDICTED: rab3 GTPase-activating protein catalytic subunit [Tinamus guttatus]|uniref:rab3 GTPase-activating protein catalytic subunit n=1 Tax=Tinamus guttatus TaxID=94827 RepID=UPI00052F1C49|nr:PREDICTED: rab3 GTPase-activating protein catalytic subunit [Tinamus guttatus]
MAADSEPESEVFEITDFTTASEWERFISRIEEVLNDWKLIGISSGKPLEKGVYTTGTWEEKSDEILFADFKFSVTHHYLAQGPSEKDAKEELVEDALPLPMQDLLCMNNDFPPRAHCLVRWYGLREFVVIAPANNEAVLSESKCNLLLSSISIALGNTGCQVPLFVQIHHKWRRMYVGECQGPGVRTDFEMVHLRKVPNQYTHLSGLLDVFKSKIGCPLTPLPPVSMAIRLTYVLQDWQQYFWPQQPPDIDALVGGEVGGLEFGKLPFGACEDPISELHLATTWPHLTEGIIVDNDVYSDLDPIQAPQWSVRVRKADNPQCLLGDFLTEFFKLCRRKESTEEILGRSAFEEDGKDVADITHALSKLTEPAPVPIHKLSVTNMVHSAKKKIRKHRGVDESPLNNEVLNAILLFLFPDAADKLTDGSESRTSISTGNNSSPENEDYNLFSQFKSAPSDSLTYKLALCLCMINFYHGGVKGVAHLWQEFVLEMRYRWENNYLIPGLASGPPDLRCCLLHQKLQVSISQIENDFSHKEMVKNKAILAKYFIVVGLITSILLAANPGCCLEDFVRWYSPRDYIEEEVVDEKGNVVIKGELSARMKIPSNMWVEAWETAKPVPARRQKRLFDDTREAEKVLHYLVVQKPADLARHLLPCIIHAAVLKVKEEETLDGISSVKKIIKQIISHSSKVLRFPNPEDKKLEEIIAQIMSVEAIIARARSLKAKFGVDKCEDEQQREDLQRFVNSLLEQPEVAVVGAGRGPAGSIIHKLFVNAQRLTESSDEVTNFVPRFPLIFPSCIESNLLVDTVQHRDLVCTVNPHIKHKNNASAMTSLDEEARRSGSPDERRLSAGAVSDFPPPTGREVILRATVPRPAPYSKALPQRMYSVLTREDFRLAGAFSADTTFF